MKEFKIFTVSGEINYNFPITIDEISDVYLKEITDCVHIADNYSLVAIVYKETLSSLIMTYKQKKTKMTSGVIPIFVKAGKTDNEFIKNIKLKDKIIIASTQLQLAHHVTLKDNVLSIDHVVNAIDKDTRNPYQRALESNNVPCCFIEFKLVPNCDIVGNFDNNVSISLSKDTYKTIVNNSNKTDA